MDCKHFSTVTRWETDPRTGVTMMERCCSRCGWVFVRMIAKHMKPTPRDVVDEFLAGIDGVR